MFRSFAARAAVMATVLVASACSMDSQSIPSPTGPSGFGLSVRITATPQLLPRDGVSTAVITIEVTDADRKPAAGQRLLLSSTAGSLSASEVSTGSDGRATVQLTAPPVNHGVDTAEVEATPVGLNGQSSEARSISIGLVGPAFPVPSISMTPSSPKRFEVTNFDASGTTLGGAPCGSDCTYSWAFGGEGTASGQVVSYRFLNEGNYLVRLDVTSKDGVSQSKTVSVTVGTGTNYLAEFTFSPTNPKVGDVVRFDARGIVPPEGVTIKDYQWDFGDGTTGSGATATVTYGLARTYTVRLTVVDSAGRTLQTTKTITIAAL
jgi:chitodextrinase